MIRTDVRLGWKSISGYRHRVEGRENQDAVLTSQEHPYFDALMIVADGLGGHPEPRLAAETAAGAARDFLFHSKRLEALEERQTDPLALLRQAVVYANTQVRRLASPGTEKPPGSTLTVAAVAGGRFAAAHVGDGTVFLFRDGRLRPLAGGEMRRFGSRPEEYLGRDDRIEIEAAADTVHPGDRLLLCTDGLTRYFGSGNGSLERLQLAVARPSADPQALASQLTADGRGEQYDDDTSVVIAEVGASREVPDPPIRPREKAEMVRLGARADDPAAPPRRDAAETGAGGQRLTTLFLIALLAAVGLYWWRPWQRSPPPPAPFRPYSAPPVDLSGLPRGGVLLVHPETGQFYVLRTRPRPPMTAVEPLTLRELRARPGGGISDPGISYRLDPSTGRLTDPRRRSYPVTVDGSGVIEIKQAGTLRVEIQPPGLTVWIDGRQAGRTPLRTSVPAGRHQLQVGRRQRLVFDGPIEISPGLTTTLGKEQSGQPSRPASSSRSTGVR